VSLIRGNRYDSLQYSASVAIYPQDVSLINTALGNPVSLCGLCVYVSALISGTRQVVIYMLAKHFYQDAMKGRRQVGVGRF
jgi:hypothetical protein